MREKLVLTCMLIAVLVLGSGLWGKAYAIIPTSERDALIELYNQTNGDNWTNNSGWKTPPLAGDGFSGPGTEKDWQGVTLDNEDVGAPEGTTVTRIFLSSNNLNGSIPPEIESLTNLEWLHLDSNQLDSIPEELGNLSKLQYLYINYSHLTGSIPSSLGDLENLEGLGLSGNDLDGGIPPELGQLTNLKGLYLDFNASLGGPIPDSLGDLEELTRMDLQYSGLTGPIPDLSKLTKISELYLYGNMLSGNIPSSLGNLTNLWQLVLDNNQLEGEIPSSLGNLDKLYRFSAGNNMLSGPIPGELGNLKNTLKWIQLNKNQLSGSIPSNLSELTLLEGLDLSGNQLTGNIPPWLGDLANLNTLYLGNNKLTGSIPTQLGNITGLIYLSLNGNQLSGPIPTSFANLTNLTTYYTKIGYNALYTDDAALRDFLGGENGKDPDWEATQTVAPDGVAAEPVTATSIRVSWIPIDYVGNSGGYRVFYSESEGGPYALFGMTADKEAAELEVTGLNPGTPYYFVVQTRTDAHTEGHPDYTNQNTLDSEYSEEVSAETPVWADLSVTKTDDPDPVTAGEMLIYTLTVQNGGPSDAVNVTLTDSLPAQLEGVQYSVVGGKGWTSWTGSAALGTMAPAASEQVLIRGTVASSATGTISNTATVSSETTDPDMGNNDATEQTTVEARANLLVTKSDSVDPVIAGQALTYTITVQNQGPSNAVNVRLTDTVPSALQNPEYSTDGGQTWTAWPGTLLMGTLGPAGSRQILIRGTVDASTTGTISNSPSVSSDTADPDTNDNSVSEDTLVEAEADVSVTKTDGFDPTLAGNILTYIITVENAGPSDAVDVVLTDIVPSALKNPGYSIDGGTSWNTWNGSLLLGTLGPGQSKEVLIQDRVDPAATGSIMNTASVNAATFDPNADNNVASEQTTLHARVDLSITKEDSTDPVFAGQALTYTITVANAGPSDAVNVIVTDNVPSQVSNAQYSADGGTTWNDWEGSLNIERVEEGSEQALLIRGTVASSSTGILSNTASVSSDTEEYISEDNSDTEETFAVIMGDMNGDGEVDLRDVIFVLQVMGGMKPDYAQGHVLVDLDGDGKIGRGELFYILQKVSQVRE